MFVALAKKSKGALFSASKAKAGDPPPAGFSLNDNQDDTFTISGVTGSGSTVDISAVATISVTSSDTSVLSVDAPTGMTGTVHGLKAGTATVTIVATWNDGSVGPFTITVDVTVSQSPVTGIVISWGTPTVR